MSLAVGAQQREMIALAGSYVEKIAIIDKASGKQVWSHALPKGSECNTVAVTKDGNVIYSYKQGVRMVSQSGVILWDFLVDADQEAQTARLLDDGSILVGVCANPIRLIELSASRGEVINEVNYDLGVDKVHSQFRQVSKTAAGTYLVPVISQGRVVEIDTRGQKVGEWKVPSTPFSVKEIDKDRLLVGTLGAVVEVDRNAIKANVVLARGAIAGTPDTLRFGTEVARLANGGTMISNWQGYQGEGKDSQLIELDSLGKVVYTFADTSIMRYVSGFYMFKQ